MRRRVLGTLLVLGCLVAGCSYERAEPGLFNRPMTHETTAPPLRPVTPDEASQVSNSELPVVGEAIWTSTDGLDITVRIAIHTLSDVSPPAPSLTGR